MKRHLQCAEQQVSPSNPHHIWNVIYSARSNRCHDPTSPNTGTCHAESLAYLVLITYETSFTVRGATGVTIQPHQILRLPRKMTRLLYRPHIWNVISNARSNRCHYPTSPNTAPATKNDTARCQRKSPKTGETSFPMRGRSEHDPSMIREWKRKPQPASQVRLLCEVPRSIFYCKIQRFAPNLTVKLSPNTAPATKSDTTTSPSTAPATKSATWTSPSTAPATKSDTWTSPSSAPATKSDTWTSPSTAPATSRSMTPTLLDSTLLDTILLDSTLLDSTWLYSTWLYSTRHYSTWLYSTWLYSTRHYSTWLYSTWLYSTRHYSTWLNTWLYSTWLYVTLLYLTLLYSTLLDLTLLRCRSYIGSFWAKLPLININLEVGLFFLRLRGKQLHIFLGGDDLFFFEIRERVFRP